MQTEQAARLRQNWGDKPCRHPRFEKEYYLGAQTGDYVCTTCGRDFSPEKTREIEAKREGDEK